MAILKIVGYLLLFPGLIIFCRLVYLKLLKSTRFAFKLIGLCLYVSLIFLFVYYLNVFDKDWNDRNLYHQQSHRPTDWERRMNCLKKKEDSLHKDISITDSILAVLKRNEIINSEEIKRLRRRYLTDSMTLISMKGEMEDLTFPEY